MPTKTKPKDENPREALGTPDGERQIQEFAAARDARIASGELAANPGPTLKEPFTTAPDATVTVGDLADETPPKADIEVEFRRTDTIPEMQARVLAVMDLSIAFGYDFDGFRQAILRAVLKAHTESDVNCWCGAAHPKQRKEAKHDDGNGN